ncbi:hypothetical protein CBOM_03740 [Ceraceosorus bombacis]|uniref:Uncharacterized protein n=1 Tax=Ceraceosorus bombacis TaxID=401625 RepID=A0A0P1BIA8_9BASI|nr:hypothetical protein CBOM_03740 [Ceraceosorus bombacis]
MKGALSGISVNPSAVAITLLTLSVALWLPNSLVLPFRPTGPIFSRPPDVLPALLAPVVPPEGFFASLARILQIAVLAISIAPRNPVLLTMGGIWTVWCLTAAMRCLLGFLLGRAVGWAAPSFFNHLAVYETSTGIGPVLVAIDAATVLLQRLPSDVSPIPSASSVPPASSRPSIAIHTLIGVISCILDGAPWTYASGAAVGFFVAIAYVVAESVTGGPIYRPSGEGPVPLHLLEDEEEEGNSSTAANGSGRRGNLYGAGGHYGSDSVPPSRVALVQAAFWRGAAHVLVSLLLVIVATKTSGWLPNLSQLGSPPPSARPLLDIVLLTSPRPRDEKGIAPMLINTTDSFFGAISPAASPLIAPRVSVFTHFSSKEHPAFDVAKAHFDAHPRPELGERASKVVFYRDSDSHADVRLGHHLHLAELLRWSWEREGSSEWVLVAEDDFPVCGDWGWRGIEGVIAELELQRRPWVDLRASGAAEGVSHAGPPLAGWVGAGGSGLILHRSLMPIAERLLRLYATSDGRRPLAPLPADLVVQQCMSGEISLCGKDRGMIISSRMLMGHVGSGNSALGHNTPGSRWRCRWRHPSHGLPYVKMVLDV